MKLWVVAMLALVSLAGCADEAAVEEGEQTGLDDELQATSTTGVIRGVVVDPSIVPVEGVTVEIQGQERSTTTNAAGEFGFSNLEPGTYFLKADRLGYSEVTSSVQVEAGVDLPPVVRVLIEPNPDESPDYQFFQFDGFLQCSATAVAVAGNVCGLVEIATGEPLDQPLIEHELQAQPDYLQSEMIWQSTQPAGDKLAVMYSWDCPEADPFLCDHEAEGSSPLLLRMEAEQIADIGFGSERNLTVRVFNRGLDETQGTVGVTFEQRFTVYTIAFYGWTPDDSYRFETDGEPVPPS